MERPDLSPSVRRFCELLRIPPERWSVAQYPGIDRAWVVGVLGSRCPYFNEVEEGWGWGAYATWGSISEHHWEELEIQQVVAQTLRTLGASS